MQYEWFIDNTQLRDEKRNNKLSEFKDEKKRFENIKNTLDAVPEYFKFHAILTREDNDKNIYKQMLSAFVFHDVYPGDADANTVFKALTLQYEWFIRNIEQSKLKKGPDYDNVRRLFNDIHRRQYKPHPISPETFQDLPKHEDIPDNIYVQVYEKVHRPLNVPTSD